jgi:hypothetical protein
VTSDRGTAHRRTRPPLKYLSRFHRQSNRQVITGNSRELWQAIDYLRCQRDRIDQTTMNRLVRCIVRCALYDGCPNIWKLDYSLLVAKLTRRRRDRERVFLSLALCGIVCTVARIQAPLVEFIKSSINWRQWRQRADSRVAEITRSRISHS